MARGTAGHSGALWRGSRQSIRGFEGVERGILERWGIRVRRRAEAREKPEKRGATREWRKKVEEGRLDHWNRWREGLREGE